MAISKFDNGHYRSPLKWRRYKGRSYLIRVEKTNMGHSENVVSIQAVFYRYGKNQMKREVRRHINLDGPTAKAIIKAL